jgi:hypothetical protein
MSYSSLVLDDVGSCVSFRDYTNRWKVTPCSGPAARLSFGEYDSKDAAIAVGKQVNNLKNRQEAFRLRDSLGINGRGNLAKEQRTSLAVGNQMVTVTVTLSRNELAKLFG